MRACGQLGLSTRTLMNSKKNHTRRRKTDSVSLMGLERGFLSIKEDRGVLKNTLLQWQNRKEFLLMELAHGIFFYGSTVVEIESIRKKNQSALLYFTESRWQVKSQIIRLDWLNWRMEDF